jgi:hypothetical protein
VAGSCEYGDEPSGSGAAELVIICAVHRRYPRKALFCRSVNQRILGARVLVSQPVTLGGSLKYVRSEVLTAVKMFMLDNATWTSRDRPAFRRSILPV